MKCVLRVVGLMGLVGCAPDGVAPVELDAARVQDVDFLVPDLDGDGFGEGRLDSGYLPGRPWGFGAPVAEGIVIPYAAAYGDYDGDGILDRVRGGSVSLMTDLGTVRETVVVNVPSTGEPIAVVTVPDFDGDGDDELLLGLRDLTGPAGMDVGGVFLFAGGPSGPEVEPSQEWLGTMADEALGWDLAVGDVNGDGRPDFAAAGGNRFDGSVTVVLGTVGGFEASPSLNADVVGPIRALDIGDVDQDGLSDIIVDVPNAPAVFAGVAGTGPVGPPDWTTALSSTGLVYMGEVEHPIAMNYSAFGTSPHRLVVLEDGTLGRERYALSGSVSSDVGTPDVTGDGYPDHRVSGRLVPGTAQGLGSPVVDRYEAFPASWGLDRVADLDGDGRNDVITGNVAYMSSGITQTLPPGLRGVLGDPDGDGVPTLLFHTSSSTNAVEYSTSMTVTPETSLPSSEGIAGDVDGDGLRETFDGATLYYTRPGGSDVPTFTSEWVRGYLGSMDVNGDGVDDIVGGWDGFISVWFDGAVGAADPEMPDIRQNLSGGILSAGDLNADGMDDVWVRSTDGAVESMQAYYGSPTGFTASGVTLPPRSQRSMDPVVVNPQGWDRSGVLMGSTGSEGTVWLFHVSDAGELAASLYVPVGDTNTRRYDLGLTGLIDDGFDEVLLSDKRLIRLVDADSDRFFEGTDCDDTDPTAQPVLRWADDDGDGFGDAQRPAITCGPTPFTTDRIGDCDDTRADIYPGAPEFCYTDNDCDGRTNDLDPDVLAPSWALDRDGDGFAGNDLLVVSCYDPGDGQIEGAGEDCNDRDAGVNPAAVEVCDGIDQDCNSLVDDASDGPVGRYRDEDGDGYGTELLFVCELDARHADQPGDCGPTDATIHPGATEIWYDGIDQDCDGNDTDQDGDGVALGPDCDDTDPSITPVATEIWYDGVDQDCDGNDDDRDGDGIPFGEDCNDLVATPCPDQLGSTLSACSSLPLNSMPIGVLALLAGLMRRRRSVIASVALAGCSAGSEQRTAPDTARSFIPELGPQCDYDGDGIVDAVLARPGDSVGAPLGGVVEVALLNADGSERQNILLPGNVPGAELGRSVICPGDLDGDGFDDLVAGGPGYGEAGGIAVFHGGTSGPDPDGVVALATGEGVGWNLNAGDIDGDGDIDIVAGSARAFQGFINAPTGFQPAASQVLVATNQSSVTVADVDGDGAADLVTAGNSGSVTTFAGSSTGLSTTPTYTTRPLGTVSRLLTYRSQSGGRDTVLVEASPAVLVRPESPGGVQVVLVDSYLAPIHDLDQDGYLDLVPSRGDAVHGTAQGPAALPVFTDPRISASFHMVGAADVDGDGLPDAIGESPSLVILSSGGTWTPPATVLGAVGDVDGDGSSDLVFHRSEAVGWRWYVADYAPNLVLDPTTARAGRVDAILGDIDGNGIREVSLSDSTVAYTAPPVATPTWSSTPYGQFQNAGDVNGDGFADLLAVAGGTTGLWYGANAELDVLPDETWTQVVTPAGDANGDGFDDLWVSENAGLGGVSAVSNALYLGSSTGIPDTPVDELLFDEWPREPLFDLDFGATRSSSRSVVFGFAGGEATLVSMAESNNAQDGFVLGSDIDGDGWPEVSVGLGYLANYIDADGDGSFRGTDCDDEDATAIPRLRWFDADGDGAGDPDRPVMTCTTSDVVADNLFDCDDADASRSPDSPELCNGIDDNCDGLVDNDPPEPPLFYRDLDGDGVGGPTTFAGCVAPTDQWVRAGGDCDDTNPARSPAAIERCNGIDDDCNGYVDDSVDGDVAGWLDADEDGYGTTPVTACSADVPWLAQQGGDCGPYDPARYPGAPEVWYDGVDQSCHGNDTDQDGDGIGVGADCDDTDASISPRATEVWYDGVDQDCDGNDEDQDADGFPEATDCDDQNPTAYPGAVEIWYDGIDQDCDGNDLDQDGDGLTVVVDCDDTDSSNTDECDNAPGCAVLPGTAPGWLILVGLAGLRRRRR